LGIKHRYAFVIARPRRVVAAYISQMWGEQCIKSKIEHVGQAARLSARAQLDEPYSLQHHVPVWIGKNLLLDPIFPADFRVHCSKCGNPGLNPHNLEPAITFFFGKETRGVRDDESHIPRTGYIHARKVNLIQDSVTNGEPHPAAAVQRCANPGFRARSPARRNSRPTGRVGVRIVHDFVSERKSEMYFETGILSGSANFPR